MPRRPKSPFSAPNKPSHASPDDPPVMRNTGYERLLCDAIKQRKLVALIYSGSFEMRTFAPHVVYESEKDKINVSGIQMGGLNSEPRNFEIGRITRLQILDKSFQADTRFDLSDAKYRNGVICRV